MTLIVGGHVSSIVIDRNAAGVTRSLIPQSRVAQALVASAGYLGASIVGCALMIAARRKSAPTGSCGPLARSCSSRWSSG